MVMVPGNPKRYISFAIFDPKENDGFHEIPRGISVVAVHDDGDKVNTYYEDHSRIGKVTNNDCNRCHLYAPIPPIEPNWKTFDTGSHSDTIRDQFREIGRSIGQDGQRMTKRYDRIGPLFGESSFPIRELLSLCTDQIGKNMAAVERKALHNRLKDNMNCKECHQYKKHFTRPISYHQSFPHFYQSIQTGWMFRVTKVPSYPSATSSRRFSTEKDRDEVQECFEIWKYGGKVRGKDVPGAMLRWAQLMLSCPKDSDLSMDSPATSTY